MTIPMVVFPEFLDQPQILQVLVVENMLCFDHCARRDLTNKNHRDATLYAYDPNTI